MRTSTAAALIGAAVLSTLVFPAAGLRLRGDLDVAAASRTFREDSGPASV